MAMFSFFVRCPPLIEKLKPVSSGSASYVQVNLTDLLFGTAFTVINFVTLGGGQTSINSKREFSNATDGTLADYCR